MGVEFRTISGAGGPPLATTVVGPDAFGAPAAVGTSTSAARADHDHGLPANPAPPAATTVVGPDAYGAAAAVGTSTAYARADHDHGLPAAPSPALSVVSGVLSANVSVAGGTNTLVMTTGTLAVGTWLVTWNLAIANGAATAALASAWDVVASGTATLNGPTQADSELPALSGGYVELSMTTLVVVSAAATLSLYVATGNASTVIVAPYGTTPATTATGYTAVKVA